MFKKIKEFFVGKPVEVTPSPAPYKVPEPTVVPPIPLVGESAPIVVDVIISETTVAPVVVETPAKAPRKQRASKAETAVKEKAPAKAKAPKLTVIKATKAKSKKV